MSPSVTSVESFGDAGGHPVAVRRCPTPSGPSLAVYCGEERHLAGEVILIEGVLRACPWTCRRGPDRDGMSSLVEDARVPVEDEKEGVQLVAGAWLRHVLPDEEYAYWRLHYKDEDGKERPEVSPPEERDGTNWNRVRESLQRPERDVSRVRLRKKGFPRRQEAA